MSNADTQNSKHKILGYGICSVYFSEWVCYSYCIWVFEIANASTMEETDEL